MTTNTTAGISEWHPTYGSIVESMRRFAGLTQKELGKKVGMRQASISRIEKSDSIPSLPMLKKLADATDHDMSLPYFEPL